MLHKPRGMVTTVSDPEGRPTAQDILAQVGVRVSSGRSPRLQHQWCAPFHQRWRFCSGARACSLVCPRLYAAKVQKLVTEEDLERFRESIDIDGKQTRPADVRILRREGDKTWLEITLREGKNRQVRRLGDHAGTPVVRLSRLSHAGIDTVGLKPGQWRLLSATELRELKQKYGVPKKIHEQTAASEETPRRGGAGPRTGGKRPNSGDRGPAERGQPVRSRPGRGSNDFESSERGMSKRPSAHRMEVRAEDRRTEPRSAQGRDAARIRLIQGRSAARESWPAGSRRAARVLAERARGAPRLAAQGSWPGAQRIVPEGHRAQASAGVPNDAVQVLRRAVVQVLRRAVVRARPSERHDAADLRA